VTGLVDTLERAGMVTRAADPDDRRAVLVSITDGGTRWVDEFREPARMAMAAMFHGFSADEVNRLRDLCLRVVVNQQAVAERMGVSTSD
jgi:DNA-binding MarR family transcriptional regulator